MGRVLTKNHKISRGRWGLVRTRVFFLPALKKNLKKSFFLGTKHIGEGRGG